jgi:hypothetical protein
MNTKIEQAQETIGEIDQVLQAERERDRQQQDKREATERAAMGNLPKLPRIMRIMGAIVLIASAATFLLQNWGGLDHVTRYFSFLGFTLVLGLCGFACGIRLKEDKGARTFLAIAAAIIPVHFCQLGALIYSVFAPLSRVKVPEYLLWRAPDMMSAMSTTAVGIVCLSVVALISFSALCRSQAFKLTLGYLGLNALLLIPTREPGLVGLITAAAIVALGVMDSSHFRKQSVCQTFEGKLARLMYLTPIALLIGRSLQLYPTTALFFGCLCLGLAAIGFFCLPQYASKEHSETIQTLSLVPAGLGWALVFHELLGSLQLPEQYYVPLAIYPFAAMLFGISFRARRAGHGYRTSAVILALVAAILELMLFGGIAPSFALVLVSLGAVVYGYSTQNQATFLSGAIAFLFGIAYHLRYAIELCSYSPWVSLGLTGVVVVISASYLERNYHSVAGRLVDFGKRVHSWN